MADAPVTVARADGAGRPLRVERARIPCLDGLRALAMTLVLFSHVRATHGFPHGPWVASPLPSLLGTGGVCLFFILSGYLITTLLLDEQVRHGRISLRGFYIRRALRIFPPFTLYLLAMVALRAAGLVAFPPHALYAAAFYVRNIVNPHAWVFDHTWSLSIEEQFYLLWPLCLVLLRPRRAAGLALLIVAGVPLLRMVRHGTALYGPGPVALGAAAGDTILFGCLLALWTHERRTPFAERLARGRRGLYVPLGMLAFIYAIYTRWPLALTALLPVVRNVALTWLLWWCVRNPRSPLGRVLQWRPVVRLGLISYSLYIWQQPFLDAGRTDWLCAFPQNLVAALLVAAASYGLVERPMNAFRRRFSANRVAVPAGREGPALRG